MFNNVINAWWPLLFYAAPDAPRFTKGMITLICVSVATLFVTFAVWALERREKKVMGLMGLKGTGNGNGMGDDGVIESEDVTGGDLNLKRDPERERGCGSRSNSGREKGREGEAVREKGGERHSEESAKESLSR
jgi:hypothetical protein